MSHIGVRITNLRELKGLTKIECAKKIGIAPSTLSQYELGKRKVNSEWLPKIADFFGVSAEYLLGMREYEKIYPTHSFDEIFVKHGNKAISNGEFYIKLHKLTHKQRVLFYDFVNEMITKENKRKVKKENSNKNSARVDK